MMAAYHLAQINIGRLVAPLDDPQIDGFRSQLDSINQLAENSPGFVWRLQSAQGNATELAYDDDPLMLLNMSVWETVQHLQAFTYQTRHVQVLRERKQWFQKLDLPHYCLWWVPAGHQPSIREGRERMQLYQRQGATPEAFWFHDLYPAPAFRPAAV